MSEGYLADKIFEAFGAEKFSGEEEAPTTWSPNMYKALYVLPELIVAKHHLDGHKIEAIVLDPDEMDTLDAAELADVMGTRTLGTLEGVYVHPSLGGVSAAELFLPYMNVGTSRFNEIGSVTGLENGEPVTSDVITVEGTEGWEGRFSLQSEHYPMDVTGGKLWSHFDKLRTAHKSASTDMSPEEEEVREYFSDTVKGTVEKIMAEYSRIFASGYEVIQPAGVIIENRNGRGILATVSPEGALLKESINRNMQYLYETVKDHMGLVEVPVRDIAEIANTIVTGKPSKGAETYSGNYTFPYKMLEYAFGCANQANSDGKLESYPQHSLRSDWLTYSKDEVVDSVTDVLNKALVYALGNAGLLDDYAGNAANGVASSVLMDFQKAFCTVVLVSGFDITNDSLVSMKVRVLDPTGNMPRNRNILEDVLTKSRGSIDGSRGLMIYNPRVEGQYFVEYHIELDTKLANAEPLFAYKALHSMQARNKEIKYDNAILGKMADDSILTNGGKINLRSKLSHAVVAGSRAGKGVWTFSILCAATLSCRPIFYLDNKPDMASTFMKYGPKGFVINGQNLIHDPGNGTDYFSQFTNADSQINPATFPSYLTDVFGGNGYSNVGSYVYLRGLLFTLGILAARVGAAHKVEELGGKDGITIVVDELAVTNDALMAVFGKAKQLLAVTEYAAAVRDGNKPSSDKPSKASYWWTSMYEMLQKSMQHVQLLSKAGLKNVEANKSDIFILTQEPPMMVDGSDEYGALFSPRNKKSAGAPRGMDNYALLSSFALLGGTDVFIGYDRDNGAFLDQKNPNSKAYEHLNEVTRGFGYIKTYEPKTREVFNTSRLAEKALYYRPMLVFADGGKENYFARNALDYAEQAGVEDRMSIVRRNHAPGNTEELHDAVGFQGYLKEAGMTEEQITTNLNASGDIAQRIADYMGYPGTWREMIMDFRPEWLFSVEDIVAAVKGTQLNQDLANRSDLWEFLLIYPEEFSGLGAAEDGDGSVPFASGSLGGDGEDGGWDGSGQGDFDSDDDEPQFVGQEDSDFDEDGYDTASTVSGSPYGASNEYTNAPVTDLQGTQGRETAFSAPIPPLSVPGATSPITAAGGAVAGHSAPIVAAPWAGNESDAVYRGGGSGEFVGRDDADTVELSTGQATSAPDWSDPRAARLAVERLDTRLEKGTVDDVIGQTTYGAGYNNDPYGRPDNYRINGPQGEMALEGEFDSADSGTSIARIMQVVTQGVLNNYGGMEGIKSIRIVGTAIIVNNMAYNDKLPQAYLNSLPRDMREEVAAGNLAKLLDWSTVKKMKGIVRLSFDSAAYAYDYVAPGMGWGSKVSVDKFFDSMRRLRSLTIGKQVFDRDTYREQLRGDDTFYQPRAVRRVSDSIDRAVMSGVGRSWNLTTRAFTNKNVGVGTRILMGTGGVLGATAAGSATIVSKTARGLFAGIKGMQNGIRDMMDDSKSL